MRQITAFALFFLFLGLSTAFADGVTTEATPVKTAKIEGKVLDLLTGETLTGVAVTIKGTDLVAYTDFDGNYSFGNLKPGTYHLVASYISYNNSLIENVELIPELTREIIIQLQASK
jgi:hypothetical protein